MENEQEIHIDKATKERYQQDQLLKESGLKTEEEYAAELAPVPVRKIAYAQQPKTNRSSSAAAQLQANEEDEAEQSAAPSRTMGYIALLVSVASLFAAPTILGTAGIALGLFSFLRGNKALGSWSMVIGLIAVAAYFFLVPYYA